ncbi:MAG: T9SS type A sorting domain-containing protein [Bacteroidetes bacterium]|nr:T9SS type A sorting domain-containing protein [Bacteroidota bacterium]MBU1680467.1 T9SS type A sorting domain-containing protein [Bacteroidota bacterium]MBU2505871.1 T9SS type A sorting domain-containing protein [Bacteroidota bacterium]
MKTFFTILLVSHTLLITAQDLDTTAINVKRIFLPMVNDGSIGSVMSGVLFDSIGIMYSSGFLLSGKSSDSVWSNGVFDSERIHDYYPGKYSEVQHNVNNKFYELSSADPEFGNSWIEWKDAVELGAYFYDGDNDGFYNPIDLNENNRWDSTEDRPDLLGNYTNWTIFSDKVPNSDRQYNGAGQPQGIEVRQTAFSYHLEGTEILNNTVFFRYVIENVGNIEKIDSVYFGFVIDPDIGNYDTDLIGSDPLLNSVYGYKRKADKEYYFGSTPPSLFVSLLQGPIIAASLDDNSYIRRGELLGETISSGRKNLEMTSSFAFRRYDLSSLEMQKVIRNILIGGMYPGGDSSIAVGNYAFGNGETLGNAADTISPYFLFSGDPVTGNGWLNIFETDWRMLGSVGPFNLEKNKPQEIILAYIFGRGDSPLNSVAVAKDYAKAVIKFYESNFSELPVSVGQKEQKNIPEKFILEQNFPNPFNPITLIEYSIPQNILFDGANVTITVYDALGREISTLLNLEQKPGLYKIEFDGSNLASGVYYYQFRAGDFIQTKKMILLK